jgi:hypothetical protein
MFPKLGGVVRFQGLFNGQMPEEQRVGIISLLSQVLSDLQ